MDRTNQVNFRRIGQKCTMYYVFLYAEDTDYKVYFVQKINFCDYSGIWMERWLLTSGDYWIAKNCAGTYILRAFKTYISYVSFQSVLRPSIFIFTTSLLGHSHCVHLFGIFFSISVALSLLPTNALSFSLFGGDWGSIISGLTKFLIWTSEMVIVLVVSKISIFSKYQRIFRYF